MNGVLPGVRLLTVVLAAVLAAPGARAQTLERCRDTHGNMLKCSGELIYGLTVDGQRDGTFTRVAWKQCLGDCRKWRETALYQSGQVHVVLDDAGKGNASLWRETSHWIFPQQQRMTIARYPGQLRFEVTDVTGVVWTIAGTRLGGNDVSWVIERIGGYRPRPVRPAETELGIMGIDLGASGLFVMKQKQVSFSPYRKVFAPAYLKAKSTFIDRKRARCAVANRELFSPTRDPRVRDSHFRFATNDEVADFLVRRCPKLDVSPLRNLPPIPPLPDAYTKQADR